MQQLPCGCRRAGRRNCIEPGCPYPSEISRNELYFCPAARRRNANRTGEPEVCPVELPAPSLTKIVKTGRCTLHRKQMEAELQRQKKREEKELKRQMEEDKERERIEVERRKDNGLERIGEESPERVVEKEDDEGKEEGKGDVYGSGNGVGDEGEKKKDKGKERADGLMPGMDADERMHVKAVLARRDKARFEAMAERIMSSPNETKEWREPGRDKGKQKADYYSQQPTQDLEQHRTNKVNTSKPINLAPSPLALRSTPQQAQSRSNDAFKKPDTVESATALLAQMVAADWKDEDAARSSLTPAEARKVSGTQRKAPGEDVNRGSGPSPAIAEARKFSGSRKVSETRKMFEQNNKPYITSYPVPICVPTGTATPNATPTAAATAPGASKQSQSRSGSGSGSGSGPVPLGQTERLPSITSSPVAAPTVTPPLTATTITTAANKQNRSASGSRQGSGSIPPGQNERLPYGTSSPVPPLTATATPTPTATGASKQDQSRSASGSGTKKLYIASSPLPHPTTIHPPVASPPPISTSTYTPTPTTTATTSPPPIATPTATTSQQNRTVSASGSRNETWTVREKIVTVDKLYTTLGAPRPIEVTYAYPSDSPVPSVRGSGTGPPAAGGAYEDLGGEDDEDAKRWEGWGERWGEFYDGDK
ncbi:hypothetical protein B0T20DRAFT_480456 [Sordaria brevicollis]|uniref:Uncharacterized protein n=1 Tax=Sordaria brevicollis TaxID=83679 RepID=A0AAE0UAC9_SORBR|nr:hypothetical protein B0T20DRAFT_480456 [Sordaria brevicollis]